jgi:chorismate synthase
MIRFLTAGESHGKCLTLIVEGVPAGLQLSAQDIDRDLKRRQMGYGRGGRMKIESDKAGITAGVRHGVTLGHPIAVAIQNKDWENWQEVMSLERMDTGTGGQEEGADTPAYASQAGMPVPPMASVGALSHRAVTRPRPGHADLAGGIKYHHKDLRNVLERASARETAARVAAGAIAKRLLAEFGIYVTSFVIQIGDIGIPARDHMPSSFLDPRLQSGSTSPHPSSKGGFEEIQARLDNSPLRCPDSDVERRMMEAIDAAKDEGDSLGGVFQVVAYNVPPGVGSHAHWDRRLDARIAYAVMGIPAIKGVEIGLGFGAARKRGSQVHDEIYYEAGRGFFRKTNNAGGTEGGISNGEAIVVKAAMKPIPTLSRPLNSVDFISKEPFQASKERADVCAVPAAGVVGEAVVAIEIANALLEKFGGDSVLEIKHSFEAYMDYIAGF